MIRFAYADTSDQSVSPFGSLQISRIRLGQPAYSAVIRVKKSTAPPISSLGLPFSSICQSTRTYMSAATAASIPFFIMA